MDKTLQTKCIEYWEKHIEQCIETCKEMENCPYINDQPKDNGDIVWTDSSGKEYTMNQITNEHLSNIIEYLHILRANEMSQIDLKYKIKLGPFYAELKKRFKNVENVL
jgi:hypothetical protein